MEDFGPGDGILRADYLETLDSTDNSDSYNTDSVYDLLEAVHVKERAEARGKIEFAAELEDSLSEVLEPEEHHPDSANREQFLDAIVMHAHIFGESLSSFTEQNGEIEKAGRIANKAIEAEGYEEARNHLKEFEELHRGFVANWIQDEEDDFELGRFSYDALEIGRAAVYNGLEHVVYRRMVGQKFSQIEMQVP